MGVGTRTYSYDEVSNLIQLLDRNGRIVQFAYDDWNRQTAELWLDGDTIVNTISYSYDAASQLVEVEDSVAKYSYEYDDDSRLTKEIRDTFGFTDKVVLDYTYDGVGNVLTVTDTVGGIQLSTETYTYDAQDRVTTISQTGNGVTPKTAVVTYDDAGQLEQLEVLNAFSTAQTFDLDGRPLTRTHTTAVGEVLAYGYITSETNPGVDVRYGFTGRDFDKETGLGFYRTRYYDFVTGTFLSVDRLGFEAGDVNLYRYVGNSPTIYVDPSGMFWEGFTDSLGSIFGAGRNAVNNVAGFVDENINKPVGQFIADNPLVEDAVRIVDSAAVGVSQTANLVGFDIRGFREDIYGEGVNDNLNEAVVTASTVATLVLGGYALSGLATTGVC